MTLRRNEGDRYFACNCEVLKSGGARYPPRRSPRYCVHVYNCTTGVRLWPQSAALTISAIIPRAWAGVSHKHRQVRHVGPFGGTPPCASLATTRAQPPPDWLASSHHLSDTPQSQRWLPSLDLHGTFMPERCDTVKAHSSGKSKRYGELAV